MRTAGVREVKDRLSEFLRLVKSGEQVLITDRLAQLVSQVNLYKALGGGWNEQTTKNEPLKEEAPKMKYF